MTRLLRFGCGCVGTRDLVLWDCGSCAPYVSLADEKITKGNLEDAVELGEEETREYIRKLNNLLAHGTRLEDLREELRSLLGVR